jgi:multiple sugar transport system permease protein
MATQSNVLSDTGAVLSTDRHDDRSKFNGTEIFFYLLVITLGLVFLFPFFWTLMSSLKTPQEMSTFPPTWIPEIPQWKNYATVLNTVPFLLWAKNSLVVVTLSSLGTVLSGALVAYSFARFNYRGRDFIFMITLATLMLPAQVTLIPQFVLFHKLGWINTHYPLWLPHWFGGGAFAIFLLRQFIMTLPRELDEAAIIDGAGYFRIFWQILLPLCRPVMATIAVISVIDSWNDFVNPLIYLQLPEKFTLAVGLNYFRTLPEVGGEPTQHLLMAASVMIIIPVIILFFATQRYFVQGIVLSGIKG